jgi:hypothetical protein
MKPGTKLRLADVLFVCDQTRGNITEAAERLGCFRQSLHRYLTKTPKARDAFDEWRERLLDEAEKSLWMCVQAQESWAVSLVLKCLGKARGWSDAPAQARPEGHDGVVLYLPQKHPYDSTGGERSPVAGERVEDEAEIEDEDEALLQQLAEKVRRLEGDR